MSQLIDNALNSAIEAETKISEAAKSFERAIDVTSGLKDSPSNDTVADQTAVVTKEMARESMSDVSGILVADALKGSMYPKVGVHYCCAIYG